LFTLMLVGVGGLVAAYAGKKLLARADVVEAPATDLMPVPVADLPPGTVLTAAHLGQARIKRDRLVPETVRSERILLGRTVKNSLKRAEPINTGDLYPPGEGPDLDVAPGMRAVSIQLDDASAKVDGLVRKGHFVDVHFTPASASDPVKGPFTMTLFKGVKILSMGNLANARSARSSSVTLELTPEQANIALLAKDKGDIRLTYNPEGRGTGGVAVGDKDRATLSEILGLSEPKKEEPPFATEMFFGSSRSLVQFRDGKRIDASSRGTMGNGRSYNAAAYLRPAPIFTDPNFGGLYSVPNDSQNGSNNGSANSGAANGGAANGGQGGNGFGNAGQGGFGGNGQGGGFNNFGNGEGL
jgi:pilus assembly protein CpaB